jgi:O-methyltransferase
MDIHKKSLWHDEEFLKKTGGFFVPGDPIKRKISDVEPWDLVRRDMLILLLRSLVARRVEGAMAEVGVYQGTTAKLIHHYVPEKIFYLFDTFRGFDERDIDKERVLTGSKATTSDFRVTNVARVIRYIRPVNDNVKIHPGFFPESVPRECGVLSFAFVHLDADLYEPTMAGLTYFYEKMASGGFLLVHDYNAWLGARRAVDDFFKGKREVPIPMPDKSGSVLIVKQA